MSWDERAACKGVDTDVFFDPPKIGRGNAYDWSEARSYCASCPVAEECLKDLLQTEWLPYVYGFRAGMSPHERSRRLVALRRRYGIRPPATTRVPIEVHGTNSAYQRCRRRNGVPCDGCRAAHAAYQKKLRGGDQVAS